MINMQFVTGFVVTKGLCKKDTAHKKTRFGTSMIEYYRFNRYHTYKYNDNYIINDEPKPLDNRFYPLIELSCTVCLSILNVW